jgi:preprotein translocase subunit SecG
MQLFVTIAHIMLCTILILIILLQPGKDSAAIFGGGQSGNQVYGSRSNANPLGKATTMVAVLFMVTSITLAWFSSARAQAGSEVRDNIEKMEKELTKEDLNFEVQKLYNIKAEDLLDKPVLPDPILPGVENEATPQEGEIVPAEEKEEQADPLTNPEGSNK